MARVKTAMMGDGYDDLRQYDPPDEDDEPGDQDATPLEDPNILYFEVGGEGGDS